MNRAWDHFHAALFVVVALAGSMLAAAEGAWMPAALTVPIAVAAWWIVERRRAFALPLWAANVAGIVAVVGSLIELAARDVEGRILFGAHLLVYLSWVFLWQAKAPRQRWGLLALAVLQVAVGSVLTTAAAYGVGMAVFLALTIWTLVVLQVAEAFGGEAVPPVAADGPTPLPRSHRTVQPRSPLDLLAGGAVLPIATAAPSRFIARQLLPAVALTTVAATIVGGAFFLLVPRYPLGRHAWDAADEPLARTRITGLTETIKLGSIGQILESSTPVFSVRIVDTTDNAALTVPQYARLLAMDEPLFRGLTCSHYAGGEWNSGWEGDLHAMRSRPMDGAIRQEFRLEPVNTDILLGMVPIHAARVPGSDYSVRMRWIDSTLYRPHRTRGRTLKYYVYSSRDAEHAARDRRAMNIAGWYGGWIPQLNQRYLELPANLPALPRLAAKVAGAASTPEEVTAALLTYLRDSGQFGYTLRGEIIDPTIDPVEDFLLNRKAGHCEYFASALALMLRAEGVPSRVVNGYKGGAVNRLTGVWEVQQRHAHSWVEAWMGDHWETLDPTPASARSESVAAHAPRAELMNNLWAAAGDLWRSNVVQLNITQQKETLAPLRQRLVELWKTARNVWLPQLRRAIVGFVTQPERWFSWQGAVVSFSLLLMSVGLYRAAGWLNRRRAKRLSGRRGRRSSGPRLSFYEQFCRIAARHGWKRSLGQTPLEFAAGIAAQPQNRALPLALEGLPQEITDELYRIRFGDAELPPERARQLDLALQHWTAALKQRKI